MSGKDAVRKVNKRNTRLRLIRNNVKKEKQKEQKVRFGRKKRIAVLSAILCFIMAVLIAGYIYIIENYTITTVYVEGNIHYTQEEIMDMVMEGRYGHNSLFLSLKYRDKGIDNIPFIETMDVTIEANDTVRITVYEKAIAGYVAYLGRYIYFDKDGIVVETSEEGTPGVPQVTGLSFDYVILHDRLPIENPEIFKDILTINQLLEKYSMEVDKIYFSPDYQITLLFGEVRVALGSENIDEKIMELQYMLPELLGKSGTLDMREYTEDTRMISFEQNKRKTGENTAEETGEDTVEEE